MQMHLHTTTWVILLKAGEEIQVQLQEGPRTFNKKQLYLQAMEMGDAYAVANKQLDALLRMWFLLTHINCPRNGRS